MNGELKATSNELTHTENITLESEDPYIPSGFRHLEGTVDTGYVIQDINLMNEFVWVPVKGGIYDVNVVAKKSDGSEVARSNELTIEISELKRGEMEGVTYSNWTEDEGDINDKKSIAYFKHSVAVNKGFYMGRYEMGMPGQQSGDEPELSLTYEARNITGVPVCVPRVMPWTYIDWSTAKSNIESMYNGEVQSAMLNSYARTTTINWFKATGQGAKWNSPSSCGIYQFGYGLDFDGTTYRGNCVIYDNHTLSESEDKFDNYTNLYGVTEGGLLSVQIDTGGDTNPSKRNSVNNIFDLGGNASEWSTERKIDGTGYRISGGSFVDHPALSTDIDHPIIRAGTTGSFEISSRPILYK